jgi:hypothetical protein
LKTRTFDGEEMGVDRLGGHTFQGEIFEVGAARLPHRRNHCLLAGEMGHFLSKHETMFVVLVFQSVGVLLWLRFLYLLDEES